MKRIKLAGVALVAILALTAILNFAQNREPSEPLRVEMRALQSSHPEQRQNPSKVTQRDYQIIAENNLFRPLGWKKEIVKPTRPAPRFEPEPVIERPAPPPPTYALTLTGIVQSDSQWLAIVEDAKRNEGKFIRQGGVLKDAVLSEIQPEHITLTRGEMTLQLALGESVEYSVGGEILFATVSKTKPQRVETRQASGTTGDSVSSEAQVEGTDTQQSIIERMRANRRRSLGR